jgi:hypothetical protein
MDTMPNGDLLSLMLVGLAVVIASVVAFLMYTNHPQRSQLGESSPATAQPVSVRLVASAGAGLGYWWRFETSANAERTSVDVFSFKNGGAGSFTSWQHEFMDAPLTLMPSEVAYVRAPALTTAADVYAVNIGWTLHSPGVNRRGSALMKVAPEPHF